MMMALLNAMLARYVHHIEIHQKKSLEEKQFCETMFNLFALHWILCTSFNFLLASDPHLESTTSQNIADFLIGAICGVNVVILIEYLQGFFVETQDESTFLYVMTIILQLMGILMWSMVCYIVFYVMREYYRVRERRMRRINIVNAI